jgi:hypothetical protein
MRPWLSSFGVIVALILVAPAAAAEPVRETVSTTDELIIPCGGDLYFPYSTMATGTITTFFDAAGNPTRTQSHVQWRNTITTPEGNVLRDWANINFTYDFGGTPEDFTDDTLRVTGERSNVHIPGEGTVYLDVGLLLYGYDLLGESVLFLTAGKQEDAGLGATLCPYFFPTT